MATYKDGVLYDCEVIGQAFTKSKAKGTDAFTLVFVPMAEVDQVDPNATFDVPDKYERKLDLWLTENTVDRVIEILRGWGFTGASFRDLDIENGGKFSFIHQNIRLRCKHSGQDGKVYDNFEVPFAGSGVKIENDSKVASKLDNLFGKKLKATAPNKSVAAETVPPSEEGDDSIPF